MKTIFKLYAIVRDGFYLRACLKGTAAGIEHLAILSNLDFQSVVDIGANRGQFALVARKCFPRANIISFEPLAEPASLFKRVFADDSQTIIHQIAIGPRVLEMGMHVSQADDSSSLLPITNLQNDLYPGTLEKELRTIQVKPLDAVLCCDDIKQPALLKMDVQGFEKEALKGCASLLPRFEYVYVECSFIELYSGQALAHEVISFLGEYAFVLSGIYNLSYDKRGIAIQGDFLFKRKSQ